jgi:protein O-GlcNAc transferase
MSEIFPSNPNLAPSSSESQERALSPEGGTGGFFQDLLDRLQSIQGEVFKSERVCLLRAARESAPEDVRVGLLLLWEIHQTAPNSETGSLALELAAQVPDSERDASLIQQSLMSAGLLGESADFAARALSRFSDSHHLWHNLGAVLKDQGRLTEALAAFRSAVGANPCSDISLTMTGVVLREMGRLEEAVEFHGAAIQMNPKSAMGLYNLGNSLLQCGECEGAVTAYRRALEIRPDWPELLNNLGAALSRLDRHAEAVPHLLSLCKIQADSEVHLARLALALREANRPAEALELAEVLVGKDPSNQQYRMLKGACLVRVGRAADAVREYKRATELNPMDLECCSSLIYAANYLSYERPGELFSYYRQFGKSAAILSESSMCAPAPLRPFPRKLRIGYVSGDFCHHPVTTFIEPVLAEHDRAAFEVYCYYNHTRVDPFTKRLQSLPLHWRVTEGLPDADFCALVQADGIDILVDLSGHTARNRLTAFARKPARVQLTMVGCMQTTGLKTIDYRITDEWLDPVGLTEDYHSERLVRMSSGAVCFRAHASAPPVAPGPCQQGAPFTFGSYNNLAKISAPVLDLWAAILTDAPGTRMQVVADSEEHFLMEMGKRGISKDRFVILRRMREVQYLESHASVDLLLDTFPFNGLTITSNALWMGVPCVTLSGNTSASRAGTSLQKRLGLEQFVTSTPEEYRKVALHHAANPGELVAVRAELRQRMRECWADEAAYTRELEGVFRRVWSEATGQEVSAPASGLAVFPSVGRPEASPVSEGGALTGHEKPAPSGPRDQKTQAQMVDREHAHFLAQLDRLVAVQGSGEVEREELFKQLDAQGKLEQRVTAVRETLAGDASKWRQMAVCGGLLERAGCLDDAEMCFGLARNGPSCAADWAWYADELIRSARFEEAVSALQEASGYEDVKAIHLVALGVLRMQFGDITLAESNFRRAIGLGPSTKEAYACLADCLYRKGDFFGALSVAEPVLHASDDRKDLLNLAAYHEKCGTVVQAIQYLERILEKSPEDAAAYMNLGNCFLLLGMTDATLAAYGKAIKICPDSAWMHSNLLCTLIYSADFDQATVYAMHREFSRKFEVPLLPHSPLTNTRDPGRRLKIAYVSPDFRAHSVTFFVEPMLKHHDRSKFEVFGVLSYTWKDGVTDRLRSHCDQWIDAGNMSDEELAQALRDAEIDIVVDLICHSNLSRALAFARKPAPVQITMIGMQQTTGLDSIDYRVTDAVMDPPGLTDAFHSEKLIRLPVAFVFEPPFSAPAVGPLPALRNGFVTFGSFNNFAKVNAEVRRAWIRVLQAVPDSRFICVIPTGTGFEQELREAGIAAERVTFSPRLLINPYLELHHQIDFVLDTFPFAGLTVSAIAAWMGVPTLTIAGETSAARAGASLQHSLGLEEFVARDPDDFVAKAVSLAADLDHLAGIRASMRERMAVDLTNGPAYMRSFEAALREAWVAWCSQPSVETAGV